MSEDSIEFCERILKNVSRSFALTIPMLDNAIYKPVMITYLQDRLLDNFEDEAEDISLDYRKYLMDRVVEVFNPDNENAGEAVREIEEQAALIPDSSHRELAENTGLLREAYQTLNGEVQEISFKWLQEMNQGMKKYLTKSIDDFSDLNDYCYYVAGTVGGFLSDLIIMQGNSGEKEAQLLRDNFIDAGLFLQKVNIIRDVKRDIAQRKKNYWPLKYLGISESQLLNSNYRHKALNALQKMTEDVKKHIQGLVDYMQAIPESLPGYRRFFAVNNALGLATLGKMEDNPRIFYGENKVKVPKLKFLMIIKAPEENFYKLSSFYLDSMELNV